MVEEVLLVTVLNLLTSALNRWTAQHSRGGAFDFLLETDAGERIAIEVVAAEPTGRKLAHFVDLLSRQGDHIDRFILVTPSSPSVKRIDAFKSLFEKANVQAHWVNINDLPNELGIESPGDLTSPETIAQLQWKALIDGIDRYAEAPIGPAIPPPAPQPSSVTDPRADLALGLKRQLSYHSISQVLQDERSLDQVLRLGERTKNITIVLSDIKNFSSLVQASLPDDLKEFMNRYYLRARSLVWEHGGLLDKFIGDAVLAVFGYPYPAEDSAERGIRFALDLVDLGKTILDAWSQEINAAIETGTRVGIATGDVWALNIGEGQLEVTFVSDVINLAARLEKNCNVNGVLMENRTRTRALKSNREFVESLALQERVIDPGDAKGQALPIKAWQKSPKSGNW